MSHREYLLHIAEEIDFVLDNASRLSWEEFESQPVLRRAVVRSLEIVGEAVKKIPEYGKINPRHRCEGEIALSHSTLELSKKKELYRRFRSLSERNAQRVLGYIDALEEKHPSEETLAALKESDAIARDPSVKGFASASEMMKAVLEHENVSE